MKTRSIGSLVAVLLAVAAPLTSTAYGQSSATPLASRSQQASGQSEQEKRDAARRLLLASNSRRAQQAQATVQQQQPQATQQRQADPAPANTIIVTPEAPPQQVVYVQQPVPDPIAEAHAERIRVETAIAERQASLQEAVQMTELARQREFDRLTILQGYQGLQDQSGQAYQALLHEEQNLAHGNLHLQAQITNNRFQNDDRLRAMKWDNFNRSREVIGGAFGDLSGIAAGVLNRVSHGDEDSLDSQYNQAFDQQQYALMGDLDRSRSRQNEVMDRMQQMLEIRLAALDAQRAALYGSGPALAPPQQPTTQTSPVPQRR